MRKVDFRERNNSWSSPAPTEIVRQDFDGLMLRVIRYATGTLCCERYSYGAWCAVTIGDVRSLCFRRPQIEAFLRKYTNLLK